MATTTPYRRTSSALRTATRCLLDVLAPMRCASCLDRATPPWCDRCAQAAAALAIEMPCRRCAAHDGTARHGCWPTDAPIRRTFALYRYHDEVASAIVAAKTRGAWAAWAPWGRDLATEIVERSDEGVDAVTWVPADVRRARRREGGDHARRLATSLADELGLPLVATLRAASGRADQATRPTDQRRHIQPDAFATIRPLHEAQLLLVDDILTTGATAAVAASRLRDAGANVVDLAVLARAGDHRLCGPA